MILAFKPQCVGVSHCHVKDYWGLAQCHIVTITRIPTIKGVFFSWCFAPNFHKPLPLGMVTLPLGKHHVVTLWFFLAGVILKSFWTCNDFRTHTLKLATGGSDSGVLQQLKT